MAPIPSPISSNPPDLINPLIHRTVRERHCGLEDLFRYAGGVISFIGGSYCLSTQWTIPGWMLIGTGVLTVAEHIIEKNCGLVYRISQAAEVSLAKRQESLDKAAQAADRLGLVAEEQKHHQDLLTEDTNLLEKGIGDIEQGAKETEKVVTDYHLENEQLRKTNSELQTNIAQQQALIASMQEELKCMNQQNTRFNQELAKITQITTAIVKADQKISDHTNVTAEIQQGIQHFSEKIAQIESIGQSVIALHNQNRLLQKQISTLLQVQQNLQADLERQHQLESQINQTNAEMSRLLTQLELTKTQLTNQESTISAKIAEWKKLKGIA